ncbi:MAG: uroporphyrinogen decarboxylase family protein, partial [Armatimonadota bacterium]
SGLEGLPVGHPLADYRALETYVPPDPLLLAERGPRPDWAQVAVHVRKARAEGRLVVGSGDRFFERLHFLRGFEALMIDFAEGSPELSRLIQMVLDYNLTLVRKWLEFGPDVMSFGDDLGTQEAAMVSPSTFCRYLKPGYEAMFRLCREVGVHVRLHSDGHILELVDDLIDAGVTILNPQVRANTLEGLRQRCKGRVCIHLDLDRQLFPFASPTQIEDHIEQAVEILGSPEGGLGLYAEVEPDVPLENIEAICCALERVRYRFTRQSGDRSAD